MWQAVEREGGPGREESQNKRDPSASDLLALHALVFPLSFPFGRLPRRLVRALQRQQMVLNAAICAAFATATMVPRKKRFLNTNALTMMFMMMRRKPEEED